MPSVGTLTVRTPCTASYDVKTQRLFFEGILERKGTLFNGEVSEHAESKKTNCAALPHA
jgi:hypothetical protein